MSPVSRTRPRRSAVVAERSVVSQLDERSNPVRFGVRLAKVVVLIGLLVAGVLPLIWLFRGAVSTSQDIIRNPLSLWPEGGPQWDSLVAALTTYQIGPSLLNSAILAAGVAVMSVFVSTTGAYVLSILRPRWARWLSGYVLTTLFIPGIVALVPLYLTVLDLPLIHANLINTYWAVWLPAGASAFSLLVIKRFFDGIPRELFEAARVDGAGPFRIFWFIVLPLSRPIIGVIALLNVMASWKDFLWPLLVLQDPTLQPVSVALPQYARLAPLSVQFAQLVLALAIPVILFFVFRRQFVSGVGLSGGIKG